jgi:transposase
MDKHHTSTKLPANLTPKNTTQILQTIGEMVEETYDLFTQLTPQTDMFFYDLTSILSYSKKLKLAERGYNPNWEQTGQIKIALAFSTHTYLPTAIDVFYGSMKEIKILKYFLNRYPNKDIGFIMDRGFTDYELLLDFKKQGIHYIAVSLKKNSTFLPSEMEMSGTFIYHKRSVGFSKLSLGEYGFLYLFLDPRLRGEEENLLLSQVAVAKLSVGEFERERRLAGVIGLVSDLDVEPRVVYEQYKAREEIEQAFDYMKNDLEADRTYLSNDLAVRGYFVVVFLAMRIYFKILQRLREHKLAGKVSVREVLYLLSKMQMIVEPNGQEYLCALPKKTEEILKIFSDLIPMAQH